jgi:hypothetical protein
VCCNAPCQGACEACDTAEHTGECTLVAGEARHGECPGSPPCGSTCTGNSPSCSFAPDGTPCGASCDEDTLEAKSCDGAGVCSSEPSAPCANHFACLDGQSCRTSCTKDEHCQVGHACREGACVVPGTTCIDAITSLDEQGVTHDCTPFSCVSGECANTCQSAVQCAPGFVCDKNGSCVSPDSGEPSDDGGCGCTTVGARASGWGWLVLLALSRRRFARTRAPRSASPR